MYYNNLRTKSNSEPWFFDSWLVLSIVEVSRKKNGKMKILAQFGIFIMIIILNIGGKKANTQLYNKYFLRISKNLSKPGLQVSRISLTDQPLSNWSCKEEFPDKRLKKLGLSINRIVYPIVKNPERVWY